MIVESALFGVVVGIGLVDLYLIAERLCRWVQRARGRHEARVFVRDLRDRRAGGKSPDLQPGTEALAGAVIPRPAPAKSITIGGCRG